MCDIIAPLFLTKWDLRWRKVQNVTFLRKYMGDFAGILFVCDFFWVFYWRIGPLRS